MRTVAGGLGVAALVALAVACSDGDAASEAPGAAAGGGSGAADTTTGTGGATGVGGVSGAAGTTGTGGSAGATGGAAGQGGASGTGGGGGAAGSPAVMCTDQDACPYTDGVEWLCRLRFMYGMNYAWHHFAGDFGGITPWGQGGVSANPAVADERLHLGMADRIEVGIRVEVLITAIERW